MSDDTVAFIRPDYKAYLQSDEWHARSEACKARAGQRCMVCNTHRSQTTLDAHHRTYERLGREEDSDLVALCRVCHDLFDNSKRIASHHRPQPSPKPFVRPPLARDPREEFRSTRSAGHLADCPARKAEMKAWRKSHKRMR